MDFGQDRWNRDMEKMKDDQKENRRRSRKRMGGSRKQQKERHIRRRRRLVILALLILAIAGGVVLLTGNRDGEKKRMERDVVAGQMPGADHNNVQAQVEETEILFSINTNQVFAADTGKGNILFENPAENQKLVRLEICRLDSGESIYESGYIKPGYYIAEETLDTVPEPGDYPCKTYVYGYRQNNYEYIGKVETDIIVSVQPSVNE